jgi:hypothetical protein
MHGVLRTTPAIFFSSCASLLKSRKHQNLKDLNLKNLESLTFTRISEMTIQQWGRWTEDKILPSPHVSVVSEFLGIPLNPQDTVRARSTEK